MKNLQKTKIISLLIVFFFGIFGLMAQDITTVKAMSNDISNNLDLEAVASIFGDANDLEDFEKRLNDPDLQISNLDLNLDGYVDYLRVVEVSEGNTHLIAIQAVLGDDLFQDVATIEVERDRNGKTYVQVVGDVYMYGPNYIIEPVYVRIPVFLSFFWRPYYRPYCSPYYWGYYPGYFSYWRPHHTHIYKRHVHVHVNVHHVYHHVSYRRSHVASQLHNTHRRNDFGKKYPSKSYVMRSRSTQNNSTLSSRGSTKKEVKAVERSKAEKYTPRIENSKLHAQRSTSLSKKDEISRSNPKTKVAQNRKATSDVYRSSKTVNNKGENYTERINQKEVKSGANNIRTSNKGLASNSKKPVYTKNSSERKNVVSKSRSYQPAKPKANSTKQGSFSSNSNSSKSYQSKSRNAKSNQRSYASTSGSKQQTASKNYSSPGNKSNGSKTRSK
ncbi:MAG: hypothetical protein V2I62_06920 [Bacteroidales bacterium]|jgi:hypothetical protein|nr:hypothetical protein [Bacteroidales bacterium]